MRALLSCLSSFSLNLICKISPLVLGETLGVFVNTLTDDSKYSVQDCENLLLPIQMHITEKPNAFSQVSVPFLEATSNVKVLKKRMIVIGKVFPKLQTVKILLRPLSKKPCYRPRFDSQDVKVSQVLAKSP